ncbi:MAG: hypothetical protein U0787_18665 [Polyangia bacterium]
MALPLLCSKDAPPKSAEPSFANIEALLGGAVGSAFPSASLGFGQSSQPNTIAVGGARQELGLTSRHADQSAVDDFAGDAACAKAAARLAPRVLPACGLIIFVAFRRVFGLFSAAVGAGQSGLLDSAV